MMLMKLGKRIHQVKIHLSDETFMALGHLSTFERKDLATYIGHLVEEAVHGRGMRIPGACSDCTDNRSPDQGL